MENTNMIRVKEETKQMLDSLKLIERESYDSVITRMLQSRLEESLDLNQETKSLLDQRLKRVQEGKVFSGSELLDRIRKKRGRDNNGLRDSVRRGN